MRIHVNQPATVFSIDIPSRSLKTCFDPYKKPYQIILIKAKQKHSAIFFLFSYLITDHLLLADYNCFIINANLITL